MKCKVNGFNLPFDSSDRLKGTVGRLTGWNTDKAYALAGIMQSEDFREYLKRHLRQEDMLKNTNVDLQNLTENDYVNINQNKFGSLLNAYYLDHYHSVDNTKTARAMGRLNGFTSSTAKKVAKDYVADLIIDQYITELNRPREQRRGIARRTIERVRDKVNAEFLDRASKFADSVEDNAAYSAEAKAYARKYKDLLGSIANAEEQVRFWRETAIVRREIANQMRDSLKGKKVTRAQLDEYNSRQSEYEEAGREFNDKERVLAQLKFDRYVIAQNLINLYTGKADAHDRDVLRNYANLVSQINGDADAFFFQVYNTKKMTGLVKEFSKVDEIGEYLEQDEENTDELEIKDNNQTVDETSKSWEDNLYKNFNQTVSTKMRLILSRVPKLNNPYNATEQGQSVDTNNELGVTTYYDPTFLTVQIHSFADFTDVNSMINSIERYSRNIRGIYGLGTLAAQMRNSREFANYVYVNFAKPVVNKVMASINNVTAENGIAFDYSNPNAFTATKMVFDMMNKLRATYNSNYDAADITALDNAFAGLFDSDERVANNARSNLMAVVRKYFPNMDAALFDNIMKNENGRRLMDTIVYNMKSIVRGAGNLKDGIEAEYKAIDDEYRQAIADYNNNAVAIEEGDLPETARLPYPVKREFDLSRRELGKDMIKAIFNIANIVSEFNESRARLNTANAEGHTASDVIKNCFITRFFDQIMAGTEDDSNAGLKALGRYIMQGTEGGRQNQYSNNPLFFGLKDRNGNPVRGCEGMFDVVNGEAVPRNNAREILRYSLFDGVKNSNTGLGAVYNSMSKQDFFITQYIAFDNSVSERTEDGTTKKINSGRMDTAVYPMRIGSDAPKIFMIRAPRYNYTQCQLAFYGHFLDEMNMFVTALGNLFEKNSNNEYVMRRSLEGLISRAYYDERTAGNIRKEGGTDYLKALVKDGRLTGNMFKFTRMFATTGYDFAGTMENMLSLYGGRNSLFVSDGRGGLKLNSEYLNREDSPIKTIENPDTGEYRFEFDPSEALKTDILAEIDKWSRAFLNDAMVEVRDFVDGLRKQNVPHSEATIRSFLLNTANMNMNYDDLFEGDFKYYNNARDFLKRTKETQAGGEGYANVNITDSLDGLTDVQWNGAPATIRVKQGKGLNAADYVVPTYDNGAIVDKPMTARNGWRAVTIYNTVKAVDFVDRFVKELTDLFIREGRSPEQAKARAEKIGFGYGYNSVDRSGSFTKVNDAQSYITLEEFIRRKDADGTLEDYQDILAQLLDPDVSADEIDLDEINSRIQVQKNFYYDKQYDPVTHQFIPRQIKNAEFVLIPKLLPKDSELRKVYDWMRRNDIGQLNTAETDKAAKKNIFTIWDEQTGAFHEDFESSFDNSYIGNYYYQYLYKQQDVPQHMTDESNKLGAQISKKITDNVSTAPEQVQKWAHEYHEAYTENIRDSYFSFLESMGWEYDPEIGRIVNRDYATTDKDGNMLPSGDIESNRRTLNFTGFYSRAREEAARLGMDSNFMEYLTTNEFGRPVMPNAMNNVQQKLESVAQALFNRSVSRQTLPGWHAAQVTGVGYSRTLNWDSKTGVMEVYLPRWSNLIPKGRTEEENAEILRQIQEEGLDIQLGFRIPTEGKQSVAVLRVVGFTNEALGSTVIVPDAWVTQTGSDFDRRQAS